MLPTVVIDRAPVPGGEIVLTRRGDDWAMRVKRVELMSNRNHASEDQLGAMSIARIAEPRRASARVLIGGLGFGFTLRAALDALPSDAGAGAGVGVAVDVAELVPAIVRWNRELIGELARHPLADPRVRVIEGDVADAIRAAAAATRGYDAIILDVDNGPDSIYDGNAALYTRRGLTDVHAALAPGGVLAVWSAFESPTFTAWLRGCGFAVDLQGIRAHGARHYIWFARRAG